MRIKLGQPIPFSLKVTQDTGAGVAYNSIVAQCVKNNVYDSLGVTISTSSITGIYPCLYTPSVGAGYAAGDKVCAIGSVNVVNSSGVTVTVPWVSEENILDTNSVDDNATSIAANASSLAILQTGVTIGAIPSSQLTAIKNGISGVSVSADKIAGTAQTPGNDLSALIAAINGAYAKVSDVTDAIISIDNYIAGLSLSNKTDITNAITSIDSYTNNAVAPLATGANVTNAVTSIDNYISNLAFATHADTQALQSIDSAVYTRVQTYLDHSVADAATQASTSATILTAMTESV
jgi:hypothetical protein